MNKTAFKLKLLHMVYCNKAYLFHREIVESMLELAVMITKKYEPCEFGSLVAMQRILLDQFSDAHQCDKYKELEG